MVINGVSAMQYDRSQEKFIRVSIICVTNKTIGIDLVINGLLGQVEFDRYEAREVRRFDGRKIQTEIKRDVSLYRWFDGFELIFADISPAGPRREAEVRAAKRLAAGQETNRAMLTKFDFVYCHLPGSSIWSAIKTAISKCSGGTIVFIPDLAYVTPGFLSAHCGRPADNINIGAVVTRHFPSRDLNGMDMLGAVLDPFSTTSGDMFYSECSINPRTVFNRIHQMSLSKMAVDLSMAAMAEARNFEPAVGFELNAIACYAEEYGYKPVTIAGPASCIIRLDPMHVEPDQATDFHSFETKDLSILAIKSKPKAVDDKPGEPPKKKWFRKIFRSSGVSK